MSSRLSCALLICLAFVASASSARGTHAGDAIGQFPEMRAVRAAAMGTAPRRLRQYARRVGLRLGNCVKNAWEPRNPYCRLCLLRTCHWCKMDTGGTSEGVMCNEDRGKLFPALGTSGSLPTAAGKTCPKSRRWKRCGGGRRYRGKNCCPPYFRCRWPANKHRFAGKRYVCN